MDLRKGENMTGRELILYILENKLEDYSIISLEDSMIKYDSGPATIKALVEMNRLHGLKIGDSCFVFTR